ncbi:hypothetical protein [Tetrasphaera phage TJE1]|uniref:Uncharacterized protein n=1 Tax=Tetrasphaera phage TJE1 TaxID=981335 RepID=G4W994_9CAUD|nr:DNA methyltransferase [Tetrasphaera phage TJE1]ADX42582.1 hypothetical protein [Tetrasphaera phage TJE1]
MRLVRECQRVIQEARPVWWAIENPATGSLRDFLGPPAMTYQPWEFGSPWTKSTALWGTFVVPKKIYTDWEAVPKLGLYARPGRKKPNLAFLHKSALALIPEFWWAAAYIRTDADLRSMCSQGFAQAFKAANP